MTDAETVEIVEMVLSGRINKAICQAISAQGGKAVGLSGKDANLMICEPDDPQLGFVGKPVEINPELLRTFISNSFIPVVAPIGVGRNGETFNVNGDTAAGAIAAAMKADRLLLLTDVSGVKNAQGEVLTQLSSADVRDLTASGVISGGMIPKTETALAAIKGGVRAVVILDGRSAAPAPALPSRRSRTDAPAQRSTEHRAPADQPCGLRAVAKPFPRLPPEEKP